MVKCLKWYSKPALVSSKIDENLPVAFLVDIYKLYKFHLAYLEMRNLNHQNNKVHISVQHVVSQPQAHQQYLDLTRFETHLDMDLGHGMATKYIHHDV